MGGVGYCGGCTLVDVPSLSLKFAADQSGFADQRGGVRLVGSAFTARIAHISTSALSPFPFISLY